MKIFAQASDICRVSQRWGALGTGCFPRSILTRQQFHSTMPYTATMNNDMAEGTFIKTPITSMRDPFVAAGSVIRHYFLTGRHVKPHSSVQCGKGLHMPFVTFSHASHPIADTLRILGIGHSRFQCHHCSARKRLLNNGCG
jgi:hypothetical protein